MALKSKLKLILVERKITQIEFSEKTGISRSNINLIANEKQDPSLENGMRIADALNLTVYDIWERT